MNSTPYTFGRNMRGDLVAKTILPFADGTRRELHIETSKRYGGGLECVAAVFTRTEDGIGLQHAFAMSSFGKGDYRKTCAKATTRCTEKSVRTMHEFCITDTATLLADARAFYAAREPDPLAAVFDSLSPADRARA